jgi:glucose-1-phosphate cytidylyltransferase
MSSDLVVTLGKQGAVEFVDQREGEDWRVTLAETGERTLTAGRLHAVRKYVEQDDLFMLTYGDGVSDLDIGKLIAFHRSHGRVGTVTAVRPPGRYGEIELDGSHVRSFSEKPQTSAGFINGGFFVFDAKRVWDYVTDDPEMPLEHKPLHGMVQDQQLAAFEHTGFWQPMDTLREYNQLNELWAHGRAPWKLWDGGR